jgi:hypothetical protein
MATAADRAEAKFAFSGAGPARKFVAAFLVDGLYNEEGILMEDQILTDMGLLPTALTPAQRVRFVSAVAYVGGRLDKMAGRAPAEEEPE